jgi:hypothetical protein
MLHIFIIPHVHDVQTQSNRVCNSLVILLWLTLPRDHFVSRFLYEIIFKLISISNNKPVLWSHILFNPQHLICHWNQCFYAPRPQNRLTHYSILNIWFVMGTSVFTPRTHRTGLHIIRSSTFDLSWEPVFYAPRRQNWLTHYSILNISFVMETSVFTPRARRTGLHLIQSSTFDFSWEPVFLRPAPIEQAYIWTDEHICGCF